MKSQFTPGPWNMTTWTSYGCECNANGLSVCIIGNVHSTDETCAADARLICAAPELLAALETLTEWMLSHTGPADGTREMLITAQDAITKAKGA